MRTYLIRINQLGTARTLHVIARNGALAIGSVLNTLTQGQPASISARAA